MQDRTLQCKDCGKDFIWTSGEQDFFASKGFTTPPVRCPEDRKKRKQGLGQKSEMVNQLFKIVCSNCQKESDVSFQPRNPMGILCAQCFEEKLAKAS